MDKRRIEEQKVQWNMDYDRHNGGAAIGSTEKATLGVSVKLVKDMAVLFKNLSFPNVTGSSFLIKL